jgi:murein L,D-transpeptidase YafK
VQWFRFSIVIVSLLSGCIVSTPPPSPLGTDLLSSPFAIPHRVDSEAVIPWISEERTFILIDKSCGTVTLYQYGHLAKTYPSVFGRKPGRKTHEGDQRTPTGLYMITDKDTHSRWSRFLHLDYPNERDRQQYWKRMEEGKIPKRGNGHPGLGGAIGIHGTENEAFNRANINWTLGCISLLNKDVKELYSLVSVGTLVYIKD